ncbi:MAG: GntR family transcriptional regulator, partial [bacterium]|jgi:DNA-binding GntR family transcriptional regulator|nr:GntR family transcriptional regulator [Pseudomonadota bacterium]MDA0856049.1 GntR family transcriptional regulator [Pseudomonadota bacterium]
MSVLAPNRSEQRNRSELAYDLIRQDILHGQLFPSDKLSLEGLSERYGIGTVPLREALNRLSSEGLVERKSHRGFFVSTISMTDLEELVKTRVWLETLALRESIANGDDSWEEELVLSYHRLSRTHRKLPTDEGAEISEEWEALHRGFHMLLLNRCGSKQLLTFCSSLMDQSVRYRSLSLNTTSNQLRREGAAAEHQDILNAALERKADLACELLTHHYKTTLEGLRHVIPR